MNKNNKIAQALTIAGSDSGGGAGIQADIKTFQEQGVFAMSVITAITAQNTCGVRAIHNIPIDIIFAQLEAIKDDFTPQAVKIGMLGTKQVIDCVADYLKTRPFGALIVDPVMIAKGGAQLLQEDAIISIRKQLLPLADIVTPNIPEAEKLTNIIINSEERVVQAAEKIQQMGAKTVIIKGGHRDGALSCDFVLTPEERFSLTATRIDTKNTHGTGCTFSACIAAEIAKGQTVTAAIKIAKDFINAAIGDSLQIGHGNGPTNHWAYQLRKKLTN